jgi:hypothetical protein
MRMTLTKTGQGVPRSVRFPCSVSRIADKKNPHKAGCKRESVQLLIHPGTGNTPNGTDDHKKKELVMSNAINRTATVFSILRPCMLEVESH